MTTITQKKKKSIWLWIFLLFVGAIVIGAIVAHTLGFIDLSWIGAGFIGLYVWASGDAMSALLLTLGWVALGFTGCYVLIKYFIGQKVTTTLPGQGYNPMPTTPSAAQQKDTETVIT